MKKYDIKSVESIYNFSLNLYGKSLSQVVALPDDVLNSRNRGELGSLIEKYFFEYVPPNNGDPDFADAGLELKTTGVIRARNGSYIAKERLVLTMIDFNEIVNQEWETSSYLHKCGKMLVMFYEYETGKPVIDRRFVLKPIIYEIPKEDVHVFRQDWEKIRNKVREGKAHEISEGDTFYLGACRKGSGGDKEVLRKQPFSEVRAQSRALSIKQSYITRLIQKQKLSSSLIIDDNETIESKTRKKFEKFIGKSIEEISTHFNFHKSHIHQKGFKRKLATLMLAGQSNEPSELQKAGILMKTISLNSNNRARESMSFSAFDFLKLEKMIWEESDFFKAIESKFLFIVFKIGADGIERLYKVEYWNMPYEDREEAQRVWQETKRRVSIDASKLPKISESEVAHVRPKARNGKDKALTPQGTYHLKQCFWLNASYISNVVAKL